MAPLADRCGDRCGVAREDLELVGRVVDGDVGGSGGCCGEFDDEADAWLTVEIRVAVTVRPPHGRGIGVPRQRDLIRVLAERLGVARVEADHLGDGDRSTGGPRAGRGRCAARDGRDCGLALGGAALGPQHGGNDDGEQQQHDDDDRWRAFLLELFGGYATRAARRRGAIAAGRRSVDRARGAIAGRRPRRTISAAVLHGVSGRLRHAGRCAVGAQ